MTQHYLVELGQPVSVERYFKLVRRLKLELRHHGVDMDEFGTSSDLERTAVREHGTRDHLEDFAEFDCTPSEYLGLLSAALNSAGYKAARISS